MAEPFESMQRSTDNLAALYSNHAAFTTLTLNHAVSVHRYECNWLYMVVSWNGGIPKSSILIGFSIINHTFLGSPIYGNHHMSGGQNYLLLAMDMAKVGGPLSVGKLFTQIWTSQVHSLLL